MKSDGELIQRWWLQPDHPDIHSNTHTQPFNGLLSRRPGGPVPEETFTHSHPSWSPDILCQLPPFAMIHSILFVQFTCLTVFFDIISPGPLWSSSSSWTLYYLLFVKNGKIFSPTSSLLQLFVRGQMLRCAVSFVLSYLPTLQLSTLCVNCNVFLTDTQSAGSFGSVEGLASMTKWMTLAHHHWLWSGNTNCLVSLSSTDHAVWFKQSYYYCCTCLMASFPEQPG